MDAEAWDQQVRRQRPRLVARPNQFVAAELADLPPGTGVDLAAGEGRNAIWLAWRGWSATAVDFSQVALDKGARLAGGAATVTWVCADATTWQPAAPVDLVVIAYLQVPADDRRRAVRGAFAMLRPGGTLLLVAHDTTNLAEGTGGPQDPAVLMTAEDVLADLDGARGRGRARRAGRARVTAPTSTAARSGVRPGTAWCGSSAAEPRLGGPVTARQSRPVGLLVRSTARRRRRRRPWRPGPCELLDQAEAEEDDREDQEDQHREAEPARLDLVGLRVRPRARKRGRSAGRACAMCPLSGRSGGRDAGEQVVLGQSALDVAATSS